MTRRAELIACRAILLAIWSGKATALLTFVRAGLLAAIIRRSAGELRSIAISLGKLRCLASPISLHTFIAPAALLHALRPVARSTYCWGTLRSSI